MPPGDSVKNADTYATNGSHLQVDEVYWEALGRKEMPDLCNPAFFEPVSDRCLQFRFLNEDVRVDAAQRCLQRRIDGDWVASDDPLLELVSVIYLNNVRQVYALGQDIVGIKELKEGHFFAGPHELQLDPLLSRFGYDLPGFRRAAETLEGQRMEMADAAYRLLPFPRVPLYYLLWEGDPEFKPRLQVLFDRSIEKVLAADAIWALVNRVTLALVQG